MWVDQHAHRHEEDGTEEVLHRLYQLDNLVGLDGLGKDAAHDEGSEGAAEPHQRGDARHGAAESERHDGHGLVVHEQTRLAQEHGDEEDAYHQPYREEEAYLDDRSHHLLAVGVGPGGKGREHHHHDDGHDVFEDEHAHHQPGKLLLPEPQVVESLVDDGGGRHGKHAAKEYAVHARPPEEVAHHGAGKHHAEDDGDGGYHGRHAHLEYLLEREIEAQREQQEDDADVGPHLHVGLVYHRHGVGHVGRHEKARHDVAQYEGLAQALEEQCDTASHNEYECKVFDQSRKFSHKRIG